MGYNVLHRVCKGPIGSVDTMKWLFEVMPYLDSPDILNLGTKVSIMSGNVTYDIHCRIRFHCLRGITSVVWIRSFDYVVQVKGYTMLLLACDTANEAMVRYLIEEKKVDVSSTTIDGKTGLHLAAIHEYPDIADILIKNGISVTAQDMEKEAKNSKKPLGVTITV